MLLTLQYHVPPPQVNPTRTDLGSDLGLHSEWPVANHPSDGTAGWDGGGLHIQATRFFLGNHKKIMFQLG
jgi:hypothetical protein